MRRHLADHLDQLVGDLVEVDRPVEGLRQRVVHERDRPHPPDGLFECGPALGHLEPPRLQPQQRGDRLQVVLHPVMDLADRRVLAHERPFAASQLGDVPEQDQGAHALAAGKQGDRPQPQRDTVGLDLGLGLPAG